MCRHTAAERKRERRALATSIGLEGLEVCAADRVFCTRCRQRACWRSVFAARSKVCSMCKGGIKRHRWKDCEDFAGIMACMENAREL
jgi:hypothetical protein